MTTTVFAPSEVHTVSATSELPQCFPNVVATAAAADVVDDPFRMLLFCVVFPTVGPNDCFKGCSCGEEGVNACLMLE